MGAPRKPTAATIAEMKSALAALQGLRDSMGHAQAASDRGLAPALDIGNEIGPLINGAGAAVSGRYQVRARAVLAAIETSKKGVVAAVDLLDHTIKSYEGNEHQNAQAAAATGAAPASAAGSARRIKG